MKIPKCTVYLLYPALRVLVVNLCICIWKIVILLSTDLPSASLPALDKYLAFHPSGFSFTFCRSSSWLLRLLSFVSADGQGNDPILQLERSPILYSALQKPIHPNLERDKHKRSTKIHSPTRGLAETIQPLPDALYLVWGCFNKEDQVICEEQMRNHQVSSWCS